SFLFLPRHQGAINRLPSRPHSFDSIRWHTVHVWPVSGRLYNASLDPALLCRFQIRLHLPAASEGVRDDYRAARFHRRDGAAQAIIMRRAQLATIEAVFPVGLEILVGLAMDIAGLRILLCHRGFPATGKSTD